MDRSSNPGRRSSNLRTRPDLLWSPSSPYFNRYQRPLAVSSDTCWIRGPSWTKSLSGRFGEQKTLIVGNRKPLPRYSIQWLSYPCCPRSADSFLKQAAAPIKFIKFSYKIWKQKQTSYAPIPRTPENIVGIPLECMNHSWTANRFRMLLYTTIVLLDDAQLPR